jgi:hypothetical protein
VGTNSTTPTVHILNDLTAVVHQHATSQTGQRWKAQYMHIFYEKKPPYAILSHTWGDDEVLFEDVPNGTAESKRGYAKVRNFCDLAMEHGFEYGWVDTCCIDKSSSSELQETICSMYAWYKNAKICYAYLEDYEQDKASSPPIPSPIVSCSRVVGLYVNIHGLESMESNEN